MQENTTFNKITGRLKRDELYKDMAGSYVGKKVNISFYLYIPKQIWSIKLRQYNCCFKHILFH